MKSVQQQKQIIPVSTIYTLDARDNVLLDVMKGFLKLDPTAIHKEINNAHKYCVLMLSELGVSYEKLKHALIPQSGRKEIAFAFDTNAIDSTSYGREIFSKLLLIFGKESSFSVLGGDFIGHAKLADKLKNLFLGTIQRRREINYITNSQFFIVYINNLSDDSAKNIDELLSQYEFYSGYFDLTYSSPIKTYFSTILSKLFLKNGLNILAPYEETKAGVNVYSYPFEENGYKCNGVQDMYYGLFLTYKIEREIFIGFEDDSLFAINALTENVLNISEFELVIEDAKHDYLLNNKFDNISRAGLAELTPSQMALMVKGKMESNYIYNLCFLPDSKTIKFNIIMEFDRIDNAQPMKLMAALEYMAEDKKLRLITMF